MGWVTLTLRKTELKRSHSDYQKELLGISRTKRQMARRYHLEQSQLRNESNVITRSMTDAYNQERDELYEQLSSGNNASGTPLTQDERTAILNKIDDLKQKYQMDLNEVKTMNEDDLAMIEEEASDTETSLDEEQVQIEAQLEAISAEIQAVTDAVSQEIQSSTIKLK